MINSVDRNAGRVLTTRENGLMENTIIVTSGILHGRNGWLDKRFIYRVVPHPLLIYYPNGRKGDVSELVQNIDCAPTFLRWVEIPRISSIAGPILKGEKVKNWRNSLYYHYYEHRENTTS